MAKNYDYEKPFSAIMYDQANRPTGEIYDDSVSQDELI